MFIGRKTRPIGIATLGKVKAPTSILVANAKSIDFDGSNDYIDLVVDFEDWLETAQKTFSCWIKNDGNTSEGRVFNVGYNDTGRATGFAFGLDSGTDNKPFVFLRNTSAGAVKVEFGDVCDTSSWYHFAIVQDGANDKAYCYQNGVLKATFHSSEDAPYNVDIGEVSQATDISAKIGRHWHPSDSQLFNGNIDEVAIWDRALKATEIVDIYRSPGLDLSQSSVNYSHSNLVGWWRMGDSDTYPYIADRSKTFFTGKSIDFDGSNDYITANSVASTITDFPFTMSAWVNLESSGSGEAIVSFSDISDTDVILQISITSGADKVELFARENGGSSRKITASSATTPGVWTHIVGVFASATSRKLYINGAQEGSEDTNSVAFDSDDIDTFTIGGLLRSGITRHFGGKVTDVAIWNAELDANTITSIYNSGEPNNLTLAASYTAGSGVDKTSNLQGYWRMGNGTLDDNNVAGNGLIGDQTNTTTTNISLNGNESALANVTETTLSSITGNLTAGKMYKLVFTKTDTVNSGYDKWREGGGSYTDIYTTSALGTGTYTIYFQATESRPLQWVSGGTPSWQGAITNITLEEYNGNAGKMINMASDAILELAPNRHTGTMTNMASGDIETDVPS